MALRLPRPPHRWNLTPRSAIALQRRLAGRIEVGRPPAEIRYIAGLDAAFAVGGTVCVAGVVLWDLRDCQVLETHVACRPVRFPYIPGLLSFREIPALMAALRRLGRCPDLLLCDGHGLAHPRRFGIACHLGLVCGLASVGCAKSVLVGSFEMPGRTRGSRTPLHQGGEVFGEAVRTREGARPVFVSIGHRVDQEAATQLVLACSQGYRLPEPTRLADRCVARARLAVLRGGASPRSLGDLGSRKATRWVRRGEG